MKLVVLVLICLRLSNAVEDNCEGPALREVHQRCIYENGGDRALLDELIDVKESSTENGKCFRGCLYLVCNYFGEDGKLKPDTPQRIARLFYGGVEAHKPAIEEACEKCLELINYESSLCNIGEEYSLCVAKHSTVPLKLYGIYD